MQLGASLDVAASRLSAAGIAQPRREARLLAAHLLGVSPAALLDSTAEIDAEAYAALVARRAGREPLALITGRRGFWTLELEVSADTLVPRPDSETLVEAALAHVPAARRVLDLGTGTGCLLLAVLAERPDSFGVGVDLSHAACRLAARNAAANGLAARCAFLAGDWAAALEGRFDIVLCNPPYIETAALAGLMPEVRLFEPARALDGGPAGTRFVRPHRPRTGGSAGATRRGGAGVGGRAGRLGAWPGRSGGPCASGDPGGSGRHRPRDGTHAAARLVESVWQARRCQLGSRRARDAGPVRQVLLATATGALRRLRMGKAGGLRPLVRGRTAHWRLPIRSSLAALSGRGRTGRRCNREALCNRMNMKRMRGRSHRNGGGGGGGGGGGQSPRQYGGNVPLNRNHVFDSSGPDLRIRGTAQQLFEKYLQLGRDATGSGDRVMAESYFQYAEHYFRILNAINQASQQNAPAHGGHQQGQNGQQPQNGHPNGQYQNGQGGQYNGQPRRERDGQEGEEQPPMANGPAPAYVEQAGQDGADDQG